MLRNKVMFLVLFFILFAGCTKTEQISLQRAPDFVLQDLSGKTIKLADFRGKVVLIEFWATWCPPCRESIPGVIRLYNTYNSKGLEVLAVSVDNGGWEDVKNFTRELGMNYPVLKGTEDVAMKYMVRYIPAIFLVNKDGIIAKQYLGGGSEETLEKDIRSLL